MNSKSDVCHYCGFEYHPMLTLIFKDRLNPENKPRRIWACAYTFTFDEDGGVVDMERGAKCMDQAQVDGYEPRWDLTPSR